MTNARLMLLIALLLPCCAVARGQSACPWLTEGTAAAMLGGPVTASTKLLPPSSGTCTFTLRQGASVSSLEITVTPDRPSLCPADSNKLPAIGNEALTCNVNNVNILTARVRTLYFIIRLTLSAAQSPAISAPDRQTIVERTAEQVAGNLY